MAVLRYPRSIIYNSIGPHDYFVITDLCSANLGVHIIYNLRALLRSQELHSSIYDYTRQDIFLVQSIRSSSYKFIISSYPRI